MNRVAWFQAITRTMAARERLGNRHDKIKRKFWKGPSF
jgi:hypothetical protein